MRKWQNLCRSQLRNKGERGIIMKRDFLRELGIEDDGILKAILDKNMEEVKDRKSTRLNSSHMPKSRMPSSA